jgi:hypothetical protein
MFSTRTLEGGCRFLRVLHATVLRRQSTYPKWPASASQAGRGVEPRLPSGAQIANGRVIQVETNGQVTEGI